jgi:putative tryptophan/tyrosine transport system substrate-binding protein
VPPETEGTECAMRIKSGLLALLLLSAACSGSPGEPGPTPSKVFHIGLLHVGLDHVPSSLPALAEALQAKGYLTADELTTFEDGLQSIPKELHLDGKRVQLDWRNLLDEASADETAKEFVQAKVDLIVAFESQTIRAAHAATTTIPIVFAHALDPVEEGLVESLSHPGGNLTGLIGFRNLAGKQLEMFKNLLPSLERVLVVTSPQDPTAPALVDDTKAAAASLGLSLVERQVSTEADIKRAFKQLKPGTVDGVVIASQDLQTGFSLLMIDLALDHHLPISVGFKERVEAGGLFSYSPDFPAVGRSAAVYVDKILSGTDPGELPVEEMTQLQLIVNRKVAHDLGLTLSSEWLDNANEVIDYINSTPN